MTSYLKHPSFIAIHDTTHNNTERSRNIRREKERTDIVGAQGPTGDRGHNHNRYILPRHQHSFSYIHYSHDQLPIIRRLHRNIVTVYCKPPLTKTGHGPWTSIDYLELSRIDLELRVERCGGGGGGGGRYLW